MSIEEVIKQRLNNIIEAESNGDKKYHNKLKEKGVECSILIPIMEGLPYNQTKFHKDVHYQLMKE